MENIVNGKSGGQHVTGAPLTTSATRAASPDLLVNSIDRRIVKISPSSTPIDQISRIAGTRNASSMVVQYYSVDTLPTETVAKGVWNAKKKLQNEGVGAPIEISVKSTKIFQESETVLIPEMFDSEHQPVVIYITEIIDATKMRVVIVNQVDDAHQLITESLPDGSRIIRMGRAAGELDVQTAQFQTLPVKSTNYCQIFKAQIEQSTLQKLADKEVGWTLSDQEESAIMDMRAGMEKSFLFGHMRRLNIPGKGDEVFFTGGIWNQAGKEFKYSGELDEATLTGLCAMAFTGSNGSRRKLLVAGTDLVKKIGSIKVNNVALVGQTVARWGIETREIVTNFGRLYLVHSEIFDQCGHSSDGMIIDPAYIAKYSHIPFNAEKLNLRSAGTRNTDAIVLTEASCLVLRYPESHVRVVLEAKSPETDNESGDATTQS